MRTALVISFAPRTVGVQGSISVWVAAEAGAVKAIRQLLLEERGLPRSATNLMGYWRLGQVRD
jgi:NADPH-dependent ferric siderophore reductase